MNWQVLSTLFGEGKPFIKSTFFLYKTLTHSFTIPSNCCNKKSRRKKIIGCYFPAKIIRLYVAIRLSFTNVRKLLEKASIMHYSKTQNNPSTFLVGFHLFRINLQGCSCTESVLHHLFLAENGVAFVARIWTVQLWPPRLWKCIFPALLLCLHFYYCIFDLFKGVNYRFLTAFAWHAFKRSLHYLLRLDIKSLVPV